MENATKKIRKEDQRTRVTKLLIRQAYLTLLNTKPMSDITVSELCEHAGISRVTFYLHYQNIEDLNEKIKHSFYDEIKNSFMPFLLDENRDLSSDYLVQAILKVLYDNKDVVSAMLVNAHDKEFVSTILEFGRQIVLNLYPKLFNNKDQKDFEIFYTYVAGGCLAIIRRWVRNNFQDNVGELSANIKKLISLSIKYFD